MPLLLIVDLVHVDVDGGHVLVAALDPGVLGGRGEGATAGTLSRILLGNFKLSDNGIYRVAPSRPLPKVLHLFHQVVAGHVGEDWEPVDIRAGLQVEVREDSDAVMQEMLSKM